MGKYILKNEHNGGVETVEDAMLMKIIFCLKKDKSMIRKIFDLLDGLGKIA